MSLHPKEPDIDKALAFQPLIGHSGLRCQRFRQMPVALAAKRRQDSL